MIEFFKKNKYFMLLITTLTIGVFLLFLPSILQGNYFIGGGDVKTQWYPFYVLNRRTTINALRDHTLPFYSFVLFLGNNIWASKTSYGLFDIYNVLCYVIDKDYFFVYNLQCYAKILVAGIGAYFLIDYLYKNKRTAFIAGTCYGLSSFVLYFTSQPGFLSFCSLAPLYILGIETYLTENRKYLFIISVFLLLITNYYLFCALSLFSPIYFIYRYYNLNDNLRGVVKSAFKLIGYYLIGVLLSAFIIVPTFFYIIQNERVGSLNTSLKYSDLSIYFSLFISMFVPSHTFIYGNNVFNQDAHTLKEVCLYSGTIICLLIPQLFVDKDKKYRSSTLIVYLLLSLSLLIPVISGVINGFSEPCFRWLFLFILFNIIVASKYLDNISLLNQKALLWSLIGEVFIIVLMFLLCLLYRDYSISDYQIQLLILIVTIIFLVINFLSFKFNRKYFIGLTVIELCLFSLFSGIKSTVTGISKDDVDKVTSVLADNDDYHNLKDYLNSLDENNENEYYRVYVPYDSLYWSFSHDLGIIYNISGLLTYDSTYSQSFNSMKRLNYGQIVEILDWEFNIQDTNIINFLSTKYSITVTEDEIPFYNYEIVDDKYRGSLIVALNLDYRSIVSTYDKSITYDELKNNYNNDTSLLNEYVVTNNQNISTGSSESTCDNVAYYDNYFGCDLNTNEDGFAVIGLPYDEGWKITVNGQQVDYIECNGGMMGINVNGGNNHIDMYFAPKGFKAGTVLSCIGSLALFALVICDIRKRKVKTHE